MTEGGWRRLDRAALRRWPLPRVAGDADKEERGRVLVVAGSREIVGAAQLAAVAALRAGAGKLVVATGESVAHVLATAVPEARVIGLPETQGGGFDPRSVERLDTCAAGAAAALVGPGLVDPGASPAFVAALLDRCVHVPVVLDALAMDVVASSAPFRQPVLLTPHAGEMAHLLRIAKEDVRADPAACVERAAREWNAIVALKGATTWIATPQGGAWRHEGAHPGLATSGSGDVLAGLIAGFAARGAPLHQACAWGVALHALAGESLAREGGPLGFLARELAGRVPRLLRTLERRRSRAG